MIYLDNSSTTKPDDEAISAQISYFTQKWGLPSTPHKFGQQLLKPLKSAYEDIYALLGANQNNKLVITASGAEAINHVIQSTYFDMALGHGKNHFITTVNADAATLMAFNRLEKMGAVIKTAKPNADKQITQEIIEDLVTPRTALISLPAACGLTGYQIDIDPIAEVCKERGIYLHVDVTHILGKSYQTSALNADFISFNGDHIHAPKGTGALLIKEDVQLSPFILGGFEQGGLRGGALNVPATIALGVAAKKQTDALDYMCTEIARLKTRFETTILNQIPDAKICFNDMLRTPSVTTIFFPGVVSEALAFCLNQQKIYTNIGGGNYQQLSGLLVNFGFEPTLAASAISFSLSRFTTAEELDRAASEIVKVVNRLKKTSSAWEFSC